MDVVRVEDATGSHIEPPLDQEWSPLTKLEWKAGVVTAETGLRVSVSEAGRGRFSLSIHTLGAGDYTFDDAWVYLNGVQAGSWAATASRAAARGAVL